MADCTPAATLDAAAKAVFEHRYKGRLGAQHMEALWEIDRAELIAEVEAAAPILAAESEGLRVILRALVSEIPDCWCDEAYTTRHLEDPDCIYHRFGAEEVEAARAVAAGEASDG